MIYLHDKINSIEILFILYFKRQKMQTDRRMIEEKLKLILKDIELLMLYEFAIWLT
jgi:hypothetical protein